MRSPSVALLAFLAELAFVSSVPAALSADDLQARARNALAQTAGEISVPGLRRPVKVLRDSWGVAHIYAETQSDLFFTQGFVAAQDRLWQLDLWRRVGEGKLAEVLGPRAVQRDRFARLLRYRGDMNKEFASYAPDGREIIESFVRGVNFFIEFSRDRLPIEFQLTGIKPEPWTPAVCVTRMAGYIMTRNAGMEVARARLIRELGVKTVEELVPTDPYRPLEVPSGLDLEGIDARILANATGAGAASRFDPLDGSNNWVVDGTRTTTGKPLLASDPHRPIMLPSLRYMVHLVGPGWNVIGSGEPALPGVAIGHNERIGWGITIYGIDQQDLYVEETNPDNPDEYRRRGRWVPMRVEREHIKVKGAAQPVEVTLKFTAHGPVIYEDANRHRAYALRWVGSEPGSAGYLASLSVGRARNWKEFERALQRWKVPSLNFVYGDVDGNIGWHVGGLAPVRKGWFGLLPVPGAEGRYEWRGFLRATQLPHSYNPASHFLASANNKLIPPGYRQELGYDFAAPFRYQRIEEVLGAGTRQSEAASVAVGRRVLSEPNDERSFHEPGRDGFHSVPELTQRSEEPIQGRGGTRPYQFMGHRHGFETKEAFHGLAARRDGLALPLERFQSTVGRRVLSEPNDERSFHEPGRDGFHSVPELTQRSEEPIQGDAVERVLTSSWGIGMVLKPRKLSMAWRLAGTDSPYRRVGESFPFRTSSGCNTTRPPFWRGD